MIYHVRTEMRQSLDKFYLWGLDVNVRRHSVDSDDAILSTHHNNWQILSETHKMGAQQWSQLMR